MNLETFLALLSQYRNDDASIKIQIDIPDLMIDEKKKSTHAVMKLYSVKAFCFYESMWAMVSANSESDAIRKFLSHAEKKGLSDDAMKNISVEYHCKENKIIR